MSHDHHHHSHHSHGDHTHGAPTEKEKLRTMIEHWIQHHHEHARSYRDWAARAKGMGYEDVAELLHEVADQTARQNEGMEKALVLLKGH